MLVIHNQRILFKGNGRTNNAKHLHSTCGQELNICVSDFFFLRFSCFRCLGHFGWLEASHGNGSITSST